MSLRESPVSEKAEHDLLLLRGQWTSSLFLKDPAGQRRRGGNQWVLDSQGGPRLKGKFLTDPKGNFEEPAYFARQTLRNSTQYGYIVDMGCDSMNLRKLEPINES